jgi:hypothetical protein
VRLLTAVRRHPGRTGATLAALLALAGFAVYWFGPQFLFFDRHVDEAPPRAASAAGPTTSESTGGTGSEHADEPAGPVTLSRGSFRSLEHGSSGRAVVLSLPDGSRFLRLEDLNTSNGPDLHMYLSDAPSQEDWYVYDDGAYVDLGSLKGNIGSSNYRIPSGIDLGRYRSAVVWCARFHVGFAVAPLDPVR